MLNYKTVVALAKVKEMRKAGDYTGAYETAKSIDLKRVNDLMDCNMIADVYTENGDFNRAITVCEKIYKKNNSKHALGTLVYLNIKTEDAGRATELQRLYEKAAPSDPLRLIYRYRIQKLEKAPYEDRIATLETWKKEEYTERWALELAKLYHKAGRDDKCIEECDSIINWFEEGDYVDWARALKAHLLGEIDIRKATEADIRRSGTQDRDGITEYIPDMGATQFYTPVKVDEKTDHAERRETLITKPLNVEPAGAKPEAQTDTATEPDLNATDVIRPETEVLADKQMSDGFVAESSETAIEPESVPEPAKPKKRRKKASKNEVRNDVPKAETPKEEHPAISPDEYDESIIASEDKTKYDESLLGDPALAADLAAAVAAVQAEDSLSGRNEESLEVMQGFIDYFAENDHSNVKLRDDREPVTGIGGALGEVLKSGEKRLEDYFGNYARIESIRKQLIRSLEILFDPAKRGGSIILTGGPKTGKTTLAKKIAKTLDTFGVTDSKKALIVDSEKLNRVNIASQRTKLAGCAIIVERAGSLTKGSIGDLLALSAGHAESSLIFLEDERTAINELMRDNPEIGSVFNNRIHLPSEYKPEELKGFIYEYFAKKSYDLETTADIAIDAKMTRILAMKPESPIASVIAIAKSAKEAAEARNASLLTEMAKTGRIENAEIMTIKAEDIA